MDAQTYARYVSLLKSELVPALGCTEPIAIAYTAAKARAVLGTMPDSLEVFCSGNIIKNVKGVTVPQSGGRKGMDIAATLGVVGGNADTELEVLAKISPQQQAEACRLVDQGFCICHPVAGVENLYISVIAHKDSHWANVTVAEHHTQIQRIEKDGNVLFERHKESEKSDCLSVDKSFTNLREIYDFVQQLTQTMFRIY